MRYLLRYRTAFGVVTPLFFTAFAVICAAAPVTAMGEAIFWATMAALVLLVCNPLDMLGFIPAAARMVIAAMITALTVVYMAPIAPEIRAAVTAGGLLCAAFLRCEIPKMRERDKFLRCREVADTLATVSAPETSRALRCWDDKGKRAAREYFLLASGADVDEITLTNVGKGTFALGFIFADRDHERNAEKLRTISGQAEDWRRKYLEQCAKIGGLENRISVEAHESRSEEKKSVILSREISDLRRRICELEDAGKRDAETIDELTAELKRVRENQEDEAPEIPRDIVGRNLWIVGEHEKGSSLGELAKATGLSKSMIQKIIKTPTQRAKSVGEKTGSEE